jgi:hypothetical protein
MRSRCCLSVPSPNLFFAVRVVSKESRRLFLPRISCFFFCSYRPALLYFCRNWAYCKTVGVGFPLHTVFMSSNCPVDTITWKRSFTVCSAWQCERYLKLYTWRVFLDSYWLIFVLDYVMRRLRLLLWNSYYQSPSCVLPVWFMTGGTGFRTGMQGIT